MQHHLIKIHLKPFNFLCCFLKGKGGEEILSWEMHTVDCIMVIFVTFEIVNIRWAGEGEMQGRVARINAVGTTGNGSVRQAIPNAENGGVISIPQREGHLH